MKFKRVVIVLLLIFVLLFSLSAKSKFDWKKEMLGFKLGLGFLVNTSNLLGLIESANMAKAVESSSTYDFPGLTDSQKDAFKNLDKAMQYTIIAANIVGAMEYGFKFRIMYHVLIADADLTLLPFDGSYNGRVDLQLSVSAGVRVPFFIMPYITMGFLSTFSFYPDEFIKVEEWKQNYAGFANFAFRPGMVSRVGLGLNFPAFSMGLYYQWTVKDFYEYVGFWNELANSSTPADAAGKIFGYQSRFGFEMVWYLIK